MYLTKTPYLIQKLFPNFIWKIPSDQKTIYLSFDDGPIPEMTPWVLDQLSTYNAKASFFCVGENVQKYPGIYQRIINEGHTIGNHSENHLNGWKTENKPYYRNIRKCADRMNSPLFRPPYGKLKPAQVLLLSRYYKIVMWDVLSGDFDPMISKEQCLDNVMDNITEGSIVVFHDNIKSKEKLEFVLPKVLEAGSEMGYRFENLSCLTANVAQRKYA